VSRRALVLACAGLASLAPGAALAGKKVDLDEEVGRLLRGEQPEVHIGGARHRVAVFTYEDPDRTGIGDLLAGVLAHEILLGAEVSSLGVVRYEGSLAPRRAAPDVSYFDKVERVTDAQRAALAVWGSVRRMPGRLRVETYLQIPRASVDSSFTWRLAVRAAEPPPGGSAACGELRARLRPDRVLLQTLEVPIDELRRLRDFSFDRLRAGPDAAAPVVGQLRKGEVYRIVERREGWAHVEGRGWIPEKPACGDFCAKLARSGALVRALLRFMDDRSAPEVGPQLGVEALAVAEQIRALQGLKGGADRVRDATLALADQWEGAGRATGPDPATGIDRGSGPAPGGAAFANVRALGRVALAQASEPGAPRAQLQAIAFDLADALQDDPRNEDVLQNLSVLFACAGDAARARRAAELAGR